MLGRYNQCYMEIWWSDSSGIKIFDYEASARTKQDRQKPKYFWPKQWYSTASLPNVTICVYAVPETFFEQKCIW